MADSDRKKALFRAKLNEKLQKNRIHSPLVRYNEFNKPICRVCDVVLKSDSDWMAHQASRKHNEAINNLKASASRSNAVNNTKSEIIKEIPIQHGELSSKFKDDHSGTSPDVQKARTSSGLPADFFDNGDTKRQKVVSTQVQQGDPTGGAISSKPPKSTLGTIPSKQAKSSETAIPSKPTRSSQPETQPAKVAERVIADSEDKRSYGELPAGFFDNKDADLRARGIEPVKPDIKDEYKEFEKLIKEDLAEVDNRFEEEEIDAAEQIEEEEIIEQRTYRNRVEELKRKKMEILAARTSKAGKVALVSGSKTEQDSSSEDEDEDEDEDDVSLAVDWRAQHL